MKYFTSDGHTGHERILELGEGRPFKSISHMHSTLVANHNAVVTDEDEVYFLGDIALGDIEKSLTVYQGMVGKKFLIPGNHDRNFSGHSKNYIEKHQGLYEKYGFTVLDETISMELGGHEVILSHFPYTEKIYNKDGRDKFAKNRPVDNGLALIHGHTHQRNQWKQENNRMFHVGVDSNKFTPVSETTIIQWLDSLKTKGIIK